MLLFPFSFLFFYFTLQDGSTHALSSCSRLNNATPRRRRQWHAPHKADPSRASMTSPAEAVTASLPRHTLASSVLP